jgi:hypothetical protein
MPVKNHIITLLLFRKETIDWSERLPRLLAKEKSHKVDLEQDATTRLRELLGEGRRWAFHPYLWCLRGPQRREQSMELIELPLENHTYGWRARIVEKLARAYSWCLIPWGCDFTSQMLAFVSTDGEIVDDVLNSLKESDCSGLLVSTYTVEDLKQQRFRGAIFGRKASARAHDLWADGLGSMNSVLVLRADQAESPVTEPARAGIVIEKQAMEFGSPVRRAWIRVNDESTFLHYAADQSTIIVVAPDLGESLMAKALEDFEIASRDPMRFAIRALESASWVYIPATERDKFEIYVNRDPSVTARILQDKRLTSSSFFAHRSFC